MHSPSPPATSRATAHTVLASADSSAFASVRERGSTREERFDLGRSLRERVPISALGVWNATQARPDPIALIQESHEGRRDDLIPIRVGRMISSPYGFYRGTAVVMAADVAALPISGIMPVIGGDAHLGNFGFYRSPEGQQVIDLNDFDEAHPGAWEWDLRRLVAAVWLAGRENNYTEDQIEEAVLGCVRAYRNEVALLASMPLLARSYNRVDVSQLHETASEKSLRAEIERARKNARKRTSDRALPRFTNESADGTRRFVEEPPLISRVTGEEFDALAVALDSYLTTLPTHWRRVVAGYHLIDIAHKVVGVGSVGLRAYIALLEGSSPDDVLILQLKEARRSVLARYVHGENAWHHHQGQRVVEYQQALQTVSDPLLGWTEADGRQYYVRQFRNMKGTIPLDALSASALQDYAGVVGHLLAKGHARTSGASMIAGYLGGGEKAARAFAKFARLYADQTEADHAALVSAVRAGRLPVADGALAAMGSAFRPGR